MEERNPVFSYPGRGCLSDLTRRKSSSISLMLDWWTHGVRNSWGRCSVTDPRPSIPSSWRWIRLTWSAFLTSSRWGTNQIQHCEASRHVITWRLINVGRSSVADPDPLDPHVFGPPGSGFISQRYGSESFYHQAKIIRKTLIPTAFWLLFYFLSLKMPSNSNKQKNVETKNYFFVGILKVNEESSRIRIRIHWSEAWIRGPGSFRN